VISAREKKICNSSRADAHEVAELYYPVVLAFLRRRTPSVAEAEDLTQDAFVAMLEHLASGKTIDNPRAYLIGIAYRLWSGWRRTQLAGGKCLARYEQAPQITPSPDQAASSGELMERVTRALRELPENQKTALLLTVHPALTYIEAAEVMGVSRAMVSVWRARALAHLQRELVGVPAAVAAESRR
jgi:RNA polymerase sigma-70 factor (ECF subfamily)